MGDKVHARGVVCSCVCGWVGGGVRSCKSCSYAPVLLVMQCVCVGGGGGDEVHARGVAMLLCCW